MLHLKKSILPKYRHKFPRLPGTPSYPCYHWIIHIGTEHFFSPFRSLKLHLKLWEALLYFAGLNSFKKGFSSRFSLYRPPNGRRIRATVKILRLHFLQTLCCFKRKRIRIIKPPSWTIHHTSTLPSKRSVLLGNESILRATSTACWLLDTDRMVSVI